METKEDRKQRRSNISGCFLIARTFRLRFLDEKARRTDGNHDASIESSKQELLVLLQHLQARSCGLFGRGEKNERVEEMGGLG